MVFAIMLFTLIIIGAVAVFAYLNIMANDGESEPTIDEVLETSVDIPEITTNLLNDDFIRISFKIQTNSKKAKTELEKRDFQVRNIIIQELSELKSTDLDGKEGKIQLEEVLKEKINELMQNGEIVKVYITSAILQ